MNFLNALDKMPSLIERYQKENEKLSVDIPILKELQSSTRRKEDELKALKTELQTLDRKIQLSLKPIEQGETPISEAEVVNETQQEPKVEQSSNKPSLIERLKESIPQSDNIQVVTLSAPSESTSQEPVAQSRRMKW